MERHCIASAGPSTPRASWTYRAYFAPTRGQQLELEGKQRQTRRQRLSPPSASLSAAFLESVATLALKSRLRAYGAVETRMDCTGLGLLTGAVDGVQIRGARWVSPQGLSARVLEASLGPAKLDVHQMLQSQRIALCNTPVGGARVVFTEDEFGTFLQHPLMITAAATAVKGLPFHFDAHSVRLHAAAGGPGMVQFSGSWAGAPGDSYRIMMAPHEHRVLVVASRDGAGPESASVPAASGGGAISTTQLAASLSDFFSRLALDLQGPELSYRSMRVLQGPSGEPLLELQLRLRVREFPPLNLEF